MNFSLPMLIVGVSLAAGFLAALCYRPNSIRSSLLTFGLVVGLVHLLNRFLSTLTLGQGLVVLAVIQLPAMFSGIWLGLKLVAKLKQFSGAASLPAARLRRSVPPRP